MIEPLNQLHYVDVSHNLLISLEFVAALPRLKGVKASHNKLPGRDCLAVFATREAITYVAVDHNEGLLADLADEAAIKRKRAIAHLQFFPGEGLFCKNKKMHRKLTQGAHRMRIEMLEENLSDSSCCSLESTTKSRITECLAEATMEIKMGLVNEEIKEEIEYRAEEEEDVGAGQDSNSSLEKPLMLAKPKFKLDLSMCHKNAPKAGAPIQMHGGIFNSEEPKNKHCEDEQENMRESEDEEEEQKPSEDPDRTPHMPGARGPAPATFASSDEEDETSAQPTAVQRMPLVPKLQLKGALPLVSPLKVPLGGPGLGGGGDSSSNVTPHNY